MLWLLLACVHKVQVLSTPPGAVIFVDGERIGSTPETVKIRMLRPMRLTAQLPGYRTFTFHPTPKMLFWDFVGEALTFRWKKARGKKLYGSMEVILIQEHGTWGGGSPDMVPEVAPIPPEEKAAEPAPAPPSSPEPDAPQP